jgi:hypothetical protein
MLKAEGNSGVINKDNEINNFLKNHQINESEKNAMMNNVKNLHVNNSDLVNDINKLDSQMNRKSCAYNS